MLDKIEDNIKVDKTSKNQPDICFAICEKKVNITCKSFLLSLLCPSKFLNLEIKKNNQTFINFSNRLNKLLELDNMLNSHKNIELIKNLFLNEKQRLALNYVKFEFADQLKGQIIIKK
jgi:hypothetical protein